MTAWGRERPVRTSSSRALSKLPESLVAGSQMGKSFAHVVEQRRREHRLARDHPVHVAAQRVDLAVVRDEAVGMGAVPGRERVGGEALVHQGQRRDERRVGQIVVEAGHLIGQQQALVDDRARRQARDVEALRLRHAGRAHQLLDALADDVELALEGVLVVHPAPAPTNTWRISRHCAARQRSGRLGVDGHAAPAEQDLALLADHLLEELLALVALPHLGRQEHHADAVGARRGQRDARAPVFAAQELVRDLHQDARRRRR